MYKKDYSIKTNNNIWKKYLTYDIFQIVKCGTIIIYLFLKLFMYPWFCKGWIPRY